MKREESLSVIIPVFNEAKNVSTLYKEIIDSLHNEFTEYQIIFVDDGSSDGTSEIIAKFPNVHLIKLAKNYGQTAAIRAGIKGSSTKYVAFLDGDGQNDPADITVMFDLLKAKRVDCVCGWRELRRDKFFKRFVSHIAGKLRKAIIPDGIHDAGCTLKVMTLESAKSLELFGELHRFIPSMLIMNGYSICEIPVNHRPRLFGKSKYGWKRMFKGYLDMVGLWFWNRYSARPLHFFGALAVIFFFSGTLLVAGGMFSYFYFNQTLSKFLPAAGFLLLVQSGQFLVTGLIAQVLSKNFYITANVEPYRIATQLSNITR